MLSHPGPRQSVHNPGPSGQIDYSYTSPLGAYPCKGYGPQRPVMTVRAGDTIQATVSGSATHDGGHCQFALSYDGDRTFVVIQTIIRECFRHGTELFRFPVTIPPGAPSGLATFSWSWINATGDREYYQSCSDIVITGGSGPTGTMSGPQLLVANLPGFPLHFPDFAGGRPDNRHLFDRRPQITVRGNYNNGGGVVSPPPTSQPQPPNPSPPGGSNGAMPRCSFDGQTRCIRDGMGWEQCSNGVWYQHPIPRGTRCAFVNGEARLVNA